MATKKILYVLFSVMLASVMTGCASDDDTYGDIYYTLTSYTWGAEDYGLTPDGRDYYAAEYWDFYQDGSGMCEYYYEVNGYPAEQTRNYFYWDFYTDDYSVIAIDFSNGSEFWTIDRLGPSRFSSYVSTTDPFYPGAESYYQTLYAM